MIHCLPVNVSGYSVKYLNMEINVVRMNVWSKLCVWEQKTNSENSYFQFITIHDQAVN